MNILFSFDPGTHATGWAVFRRDGAEPWRLVACGVRMRPPRGENRRDSELARRGRAVRAWRRRRKARLSRLRRLLDEAGLLPSPGAARDAVFAADPWALRKAGQTVRLGPGEIGRAILHMAKRRGFVDPHGAPAPGFPIDWAWPRHNAPVRRRRAVRLRAGLADPPPPTRRAGVLAELAAFWVAQARFHEDALSADLLRRIVAAGFIDAPPGTGAKQPANPVVRVALADLAGLCRALVARFGQPACVVAEACLPLDRRSLAAGPSAGVARRIRLRDRPATGEPDNRLSRDWEIDHIIPLARGGRRTRANEELRPAGDNRGKGAGTASAGDAPVAFARRRGRDMAMLGARLIAVLARACGRAPVLSPPDRVARAALDMRLRQGEGKDRDDIGHNALDAVAVAASAVADIAVPAPECVRAAMAFSVAADRAPHGRMHGETIYSAGPAQGGRPTVVARKAVAALSPGEAGRLRDGRLCGELAACVAAAGGHEAGLAAFAALTGIRHVRLVRPAADAIVLPANAGGAPARMALPKRNHAIDIVALRDGAWRAFGVSLHDRMAKDWRPQWERLRLGGKLVMRLHRGDCVELDGDAGRIVLRVHRLAPSNGYVWLAGLAEAGDLGRRHADPGDPFRFAFLSAKGLFARRARAIDISADGRIKPRRCNVQPVFPGSGGPDPEAPETGRPTATDSVCRQAGRR